MTHLLPGTSPRALPATQPAACPLAPRPARARGMCGLAWAKLSIGEVKALDILKHYLSQWHLCCPQVVDMSEGPDVKIQVVYEGGVFKPLQDVDLREGTKAFVILKPGRITNVARRYRIKVDRDVMSEFVEERR
jgi:predicted DNA-binding antitoxin AbrB/MazE fold protein